jgi:hypothetical protein
MNNLDKEVIKKNNIVGYKTITKDILRSILNKSIMYIKRLYMSHGKEDTYEFKNIPVIIKNSQTKQYVLTISDNIPPIICKTKKECITDDNMSKIHLGFYKKTNDGINRYAFYYMNKPISIIDDSPTFLNYLNPTEAEFMEHFIGILPRTLKNNMRINLEKSKYLSTVKYPVSEKNISKKTRRISNGVKWNSQVHVKHFYKNLPVAEPKTPKKVTRTMRRFRNIVNPKELMSNNSDNLGISNYTAQ